MLVDEGVLLVKLWFHLSKKQQRRRLEELEADKKTRWRVGEEEWRFFKLYDTFRDVNEHLLRSTSTGEAPWLVVPGADPEYRAVTVGRALLKVMKERLALLAPRKPAQTVAPLPPRIDRLDVIRATEDTGWFQAPRNVAFTIIGWLYGDNDFGKSIWHSYRTRVTQWEIDEYLPLL